MASVPPFSTFTAISELFVTAAVFYFLWQAVRHDDFRWPLIAITIAFETIVNITYMASRLVFHLGASSDLDPPAWYLVLVIAHGTLSLAMFLGLVAMVAVAFRRQKVDGVNLFRKRLGLTRTFVVLWILSVGSGEAVYVVRWLGLA